MRKEPCWSGRVRNATSDAAEPFNILLRELQPAGCDKAIQLLSAGYAGQGRGDRGLLSKPGQGYCRRVE
jgi:hypothetical protein